MVATSTSPKNQVRNTSSVKGTGTIDPLVKNELVPTTTSGDVAVNPPVLPMDTDEVDLDAQLKALQASIQAVQAKKEAKEEAERNKYRAQIEAKQAELDPLILARDEAKRQYDALSSKCAGLQVDINEILKNPVFPQSTAKKASAAKREHSPDQMTSHGVLFAVDEIGNKTYDSKGRLRVDKRSLRHKLNENPSLASLYDYEMGVALFAV